MRKAAATVTVGVAPFGIAVDQSTNKIYVANNNGGDTSASLSVINGASCDTRQDVGLCRTATGTTGPGYAPNGIALDPTNHVLYTANFYGANVSAIDVASTKGSQALHSLPWEAPPGPCCRSCEPHRLRLEQSRWDRLDGGGVERRSLFWVAAVSRMANAES